MRFKDINGEPIGVGDRITPCGWGGDVPLYLGSSVATVVGFGRTRIRVRFDMEAYGGQWPEFRAIGTYVIKVKEQA